MPSSEMGGLVAGADLQIALVMFAVGIWILLAGAVMLFNDLHKRRGRD